ncbi:DMT family transporter [Aquabacterium sp.]|uniref:DMT family transporter n=1 Tax=Aquabacterium sp. TaxID=1872578 RepID=UPI002B50A2BC|nr:DMT family transporter [Aquabacterium sp.]HSW08486.1 DMT family transporter [Aquabacterium sp.]
MTPSSSLDAGLPAARPAQVALAGAGMALLAATLWGTTGTAQSLAPSGLPATWVGALRLVVASLFFLAFVLLQREPLRRGLAQLRWQPVLLAGACIAAYNLAFFAGVRASGIAVGTAVAIGSGPIWAGLLETLFTRQAPRRSWWCGTLLAVAGGSLLVLAGTAQLQASPLGIALCLIAGLSYAAYALLNKQLVTNAPPAIATLAVFGSAALIATPLAWALAGPVSVTASGAAVLLYLGVVATGVSYLLFSSAQRHIAGSTAVTLALGEPITAFGLAILVVGEQPRPAAFIGLAMVMAGLGVVVWTEWRAARQVGL